MERMITRSARGLSVFIMRVIFLFESRTMMLSKFCEVLNSFWLVFSDEGGNNLDFGVWIAFQAFTEEIFVVADE